MGRYKRGEEENITDKAHLKRKRREKNRFSRNLRAQGIKTYIP